MQVNHNEYSCSIRALQHFMYCPHRWGLIYNDCSWAENAFVTKANLLHNRVHDPDRAYTSRNKRVLTSTTVYNDDLNIYGVTDCIEMERGNDLSDITASSSLTVVEYKPRKPSNALYNEDDCIQVFAQKVCLDWMFHCKTKGILYYADVKKRIPLPLEDNYDTYYQKLTELLNRIRMYIANGEVPSIRKGQKCRGCSFLNMCMPKANKRLKKSLFQQLEEMYP